MESWCLPWWKKPKPLPEPPLKTEPARRKAAQMGGLARAQYTRRRRKAEKALGDKYKSEAKNKEG